MFTEQQYRQFKMTQKIQSLGSTSDSNELNQTQSPPPPSATASAHLLNQTASSVGNSPEPPSNLPFSTSNRSSPLLDYNKAMATMLLPTDLSVSFQASRTNSGGDSMKSSQTTSTSLTALDLSTLLYGASGGSISNSMLPLDILQQLEYQKQLLLRKQQQHQQTMQERKNDSLDDDSMEVDNSIEAGIPKSVIQNTEFMERHPSVDDVEQMIRNFFTQNCTRQQNSGDIDLDDNNRKNDPEQYEPLNLNLKSNTGKRNSNPVNMLECSLSPTHPLADQDHLHCLIPNCDAIVPRVYTDISEHIRAHNIRTNPYANIEQLGIAAISNDVVISDPKLLQITSIDGFFNRKRGRPPKNRVVEVYNNVRRFLPIY